MLPDIAAEERGAGAVHQRIVLIRSGGDSELAVLDDEPCPAAAEAGDTSLGEGFLEGIEGTEGRVDRGSEVTGWSATGVRAHDVPEEGVVEVTTAVVADRATDGLRDIVDTLAEVFDGEGFQLSIAREGVVEIGHVSIVVTAMMDLHRGGVDVRFKSCLVVRKGGKSVSHGVVVFELRVRGVG